MHSLFCGSSPQESSLWTRGIRSPDSDLSPVTPSTPSEYRWSEVIPPKTALKFAVLWDDSEDYVAFSGGELLDDSRTEDIFLRSPISPSDACSQVLSVGPASTVPLSEQSSTMMYFREDMASVLDRSSPSPIPLSRNRKVLGQQTRTSSTLDGLDVYLRGSLLRQGHRNVRYYSCLESLDGEFDFDPRTSFAKEYCTRRQTGGKGADVVDDNDDMVTDEGFYEVLIAPRQHDDSGLNESSFQKREPHSKPKSRYAYSIATTTTTDTLGLGFVSIDADDASSIWSTVEAPKSASPLGYTGFVQCMDQRSPSTRRQRLRKPRPPNVPAPPSEVLRRDVFSHQVRLPLENPDPKKNGKVEDTRFSSQQRKNSLVRLVRQISKKNSNSKPGSVLGGDNQWICVEVSHEVRQRCM